MKLNELKHNHSLTELLKILIFSLLMLAPLLASVSQMLYATFNKNAYLSYSGSNDEIQYVQTDFPEIEIGNKYVFKTENFITYESAPTNTSRIDMHVSEFYYSQTIPSVSGNLSFLYYSSQNCIRLQFVNNDLGLNSSWYTNYNIFNTSFVVDNILQLGNLYTEINQYLYKYEIVSATHLDNAFYYGVEQMTESELFNWTQNTALYSGIYGMTSNLEIQTPAIAILLTYWTILTIIYVIIDIVLKGFTYMTHFLQMKV